MAATMGNGASPWRPYMACNKSACSVLVGSPVEGPPRWMSMITSGSSRLMASPTVSALRSTPGPARGGHAEGATEGGTEGGADPGDLVLGLKGPDAELLVLRQLVEDVRGGGDRVGAEEERAARSGWTAAMRPQAAAVFPVMFMYSPGSSSAGRTS